MADEEQEERSKYDELFREHQDLVHRGFQGNEKEQLKAMLNAKPLRIALAIILNGQSDMGRILLQSNLATEEGRLEAISKQGRAQGLVAAVEAIFEMVEEDPE